MPFCVASPVERGILMGMGVENGTTDLSQSVTELTTAIATKN